MTKRFKNECRQSLPTSSRLAIRCFIYEPGSGWKPIGIDRVAAIQNGETCAPKPSDKVIRIAFAYIDTEGRTATILRNLTVSEWKIGADGFVDQTEMMSRVVEMIDGGVGVTGDIVPTPQDVEAIKRCLGLST